MLCVSEVKAKEDLAPPQGGRGVEDGEVSCRQCQTWLPPDGMLQGMNDACNSPL